ncbi:MAG: polysaccharide deacetylase family protein [Chthoniobacteraceae bacterium]
MPSRSLVVSIHDVSPLTFEASRTILSALEKWGVRHCSLLVIPNHHLRGHFLDDRKFCDWLVTQGQAGHEIIIHGYTHQRERRQAESPWQKMMTRTYTADEGEFYDIDEKRATELLTRAHEEFATIGFHPPGFIAPAWLLSDAGEQALRKAEIAYTTRLGNVLHLPTGTKHDAISMVYSVRSAWRRAASLVWNASLFRRLKTNPLLRVSIHPPDLDHTAIWRQINKYITLALEDREPMTYWEWVSSHSGFHSDPIHGHVQG